MVANNRRTFCFFGRRDDFFAMKICQASFPPAASRTLFDDALVKFAALQ
jgi:hypothetical protein